MVIWHYSIGIPLLTTKLHKIFCNILKIFQVEGSGFEPHHVLLNRTSNLLPRLKVIDCQSQYIREKIPS